MTTNLTMRRPFRLPFRQQVFLFDDEEMRRLFPEGVVDTMQAGVPPSRHMHPGPARRCTTSPGPGVRTTTSRARDRPPCR